MALDADTLLDRMQLKQQLLRWRSIAILLLTLIALLLVHRSFDVSQISSSDYIATIRIDGVIAVDPKRKEILEQIEKSDRVKALLVYLDTPGGTAIGGEELYLDLKRIGENKPVVILMRTLCTSAGYMAALGGEYILAREGTLTGSIGVIMQAMELTEAAEALGITPIIVRSGPNKATPNPFDKLEPAQRRVIEGVVDDFYAFFLRLVKDERAMDDAALKTLADGRIFTGRQALEAGLIDALGGKEEALAYLQKTHQIDPETPIRELKPKRERESIFNQLNQLGEKLLIEAKNFPLALDGLVSIWHPADHSLTP